MGQYYMPVLRDENGNFCAFYSHTYDNGLKLMEHSYIGNNFVNAVCNQIYKKPHNVCWFGDYIKNEEILQLSWIETKEDAEQFYEKVWNDKIPYIEPTYENECFDWKSDNYLINHTKKLCFLMPKDNDEDWLVHPLPLLTAKSNGRGGGDYRGDCYYVGEWWGDLIEISNEPPKEYELMEYDEEIDD